MDIFSRNASGIDFLWAFPKDRGPRIRLLDNRWFRRQVHGGRLSEPLRGISHGGFSLSLESLVDHEITRRSWVEECFPDPGSTYDVVWHNKLAVIPVGNGDYIAIDLSSAHHGEIVYLSHDEGEGHGYVLGSDFADFLRRWTPLGCCGPEDWQWFPFTSGRTSMLEPEGDLADSWREILGLVKSDKGYRLADR